MNDNLPKLYVLSSFHLSESSSCSLCDRIFANDVSRSEHIEFSDLCILFSHWALALSSDVRGSNFCKMLIYLPTHPILWLGKIARTKKLVMMMITPSQVKDEVKLKILGGCVSPTFFEGWIIIKPASITYIVG